MSSLERKTGCVVAERSLFPEILSMTILARKKLTIMNIFLVMTGATFPTCPTQYAIVDMAHFTVQLQMPADKQEISMKVAGVFEANIFIMTARTVLPE
jgi:hypothetical protein